VQPVHRILLASLIGTTIEFFDFYIYATAAVLVFPTLFFPKQDPATAMLQSFATFALACGCATHKEPEKLGALRLHVECAPSLPDKSQTVKVLRSHPVLVTIGEDPVLTEANLIKATLMETPGGFAIRVKFDETGSWMLEQSSSANPGKHFAIFGQWGETLAECRWLAAPLISHRIADGVLTFTPDCSREEAQELVTGLNNAAKKMQTGQ